jgi:sulfatase modifying factor 1
MGVDFVRPKLPPIVLWAGFAAGLTLATAASQSSAVGPHCDLHSAAAPHRSAAPASSPSLPSKGSVDHAAMVHLTGGEFWMGSQVDDLPDALPVHRVRVHPFWIDKTDVTNAQFAQFVRATGYVTVAERPLDPKDFPNVAIEKLKAGGAVFTGSAAPVSLDDATAWWSWTPGANWRHPEGPQSGIAGKQQYPVVQIAWEDASAYARWAHKRLPTEAEWEFAARGGLDRQPYTWGAELKPHGKWQANIFQGQFPYRNSHEDGFSGRAPVDSFPPNGYGLYDMAGNVWQWCSDWYRPDYYQTIAAAAVVADNPAGPSQSLDPQEPEVPKRVQKGGSFLCTDEYCARFRPGARGKGDPQTPTNHAGFRCVSND